MSHSSTSILLIMANDLLKQINKIKSTISTNDQIVWACQAATKCYTDEISHLKDEEERLMKDICKIDEQIKESKPLIGILEKCSELQNDTLKISLESLVTHRLYQKCVEENINKHKKECDLLIGEYSEHIEQCKTKLEHTNPLFKILQEKRTELKKSKIQCLDLQQRLKRRKVINEQKLRIQKQLFYADIVSFAEAWLDQKKYLDAIKEYEVVKHQERELMIKLMELTEELRVKDKMAYVTKDTSTFIPQIQFSKNSIDDGSINNNKNTANTANYEKPSVNPLKDLEVLLKENNFGQSGPIKKVGTTTGYSNKNNHLTDNSYIPTKVRILENKTLKPPHPHQPVIALSKEERSKAIDAKLQRVMQNFSRSMSRQNSQRISKSYQIPNGNLKGINDVTSPEEADKEPIEEMNKSQTGATEGLENMNILSQETRMAMVLLSQDSVKGSSAEANLKKFKYPTDNYSKEANKKVENTNSDCENGILQKMDVDDRQQKHGILNTNLFKMNDGNAFGKNGQFSMNLGGSNPGNIFKNDINNTLPESNVFPMHTSGTNGIFQPMRNTSSFSQPFKMNDNKENNPNKNVFKVPEAASANNLPSQPNQNTTINSSDSSVSTNLKDSQNLPLHEETNFFSMHGAHYNFGNTMTQITENPNDSYEMAWSPPATDFSNKSFMDTNPLLPFGQSNTTFGFSFFK
ncbi:unnamed protein product [Phaedon cochleariae]|uniref:Uncharacterized protein n=1 Tax=Phaedon cochleariae TaxID=80249 RepID=A0A9P0DMT0_PHACE|nr:unnamed protein product [Phaedon cochleariae]